MEFWFLQFVPNEEEDKPGEGQEHESQGDLLAETVVDTEVPIALLVGNVLGGQTDADGEEEDIEESEEEEDDPHAW